MTERATPLRPMLRSRSTAAARPSTSRKKYVALMRSAKEALTWCTQFNSHFTHLPPVDDLDSEGRRREECLCYQDMAQRKASKERGNKLQHASNPPPEHLRNVNKVIVDECKTARNLLEGHILVSFSLHLQLPCPPSLGLVDLLLSHFAETALVCACTWSALMDVRSSFIYTPSTKRTVGGTAAWLPAKSFGDGTRPGSSSSPVSECDAHVQSKTLLHRHWRRCLLAADQPGQSRWCD